MISLLLTMGCRLCQNSLFYKPVVVMLVLEHLLVFDNYMLVFALHAGWYL